MTSASFRVVNGTRRSDDDEVPASGCSGSAAGRRAVATRTSQQVFSEGLHAWSIVCSSSAPQVLSYGLPGRGDDRGRVGRTAGYLGADQGSGPFHAVVRRAKAPGKRGFAKL